MTTTTSPMLAFHGDSAIKAKYLDRLAEHRKADEIQNGFYWEGGKGCAVGCTIHGNDHGAYERELGVPRILARLEDRLFEAIYTSNPATAKDWPHRFLSSIPVGADLSMVWPRFALWLLADENEGVVKFAKREASRAAILGVSALYQRWVDGDKPSRTEWERAGRTAAAAAAAYAYAYACAAAAYASKKHYLKMADKLVELMQAATVKHS